MMRLPHGVGIKMGNPWTKINVLLAVLNAYQWNAVAGGRKEPLRGVFHFVG